MPLEHLEHFLIQTTQLQATRDWYVDVLGMREGSGAWIGGGQAFAFGLRRG